MKIKYYVERAFRTFNRPELRILPGNIAFFFVLALIPIVSTLVMIASYFSVSMDIIFDFINGILPKEASNLVVDAMFGKELDKGIGILNLVILFVASNGTYAIITASNTLYRSSNDNVIRDRLKSVISLLILLLLLIFLIIVPVLGSKLLALFSGNDVFSSVIVMFNWLKWPISICLIYGILKLIYFIAPNVKVSSKSTTIGSLLTTIVWTISTVGFGYYLEYFANYSAVYGGLSSLIVLMIWLYIISYGFVFGLALNAADLNDN